MAVQIIQSFCDCENAVCPVPKTVLKAINHLSKKCIENYATDQQTDNLEQQEYRGVVDISLLLVLYIIHIYWYVCTERRIRNSSQLYKMPHGSFVLESRSIDGRLMTYAILWTPDQEKKLSMHANDMDTFQ